MLEESGIVKGYTAVIDQRLVGLPVSAFASIKLDRQREEDLDRFAQAVAHWPEIVDCYLMTGPRDYLMRIVVRDLDAYEQFIKHQVDAARQYRVHRDELRAGPGQAIGDPALVTRCQSL